MKNILIALMAFGFTHSYQVAQGKTIRLFDGKVSEEQMPFVEIFLGQFSVRDNSLFSSDVGTVEISMDDENRINLKSSMEITGQKCQSQVENAVELNYNPNAGVDTPVEIQFIINRRDCTVAGNTLTLHYNQALTGKDIYQIRILVKKASRSRPGRRGSNDVEKVWRLELQN